MAEYVAFVGGLPLTCNPMKIKLRFESECKVHIESIKVEAECAEVKLANEKDRKTFCHNLPPSIKFGNDEYTLTLLNKDKTSPSAVNKVNNTPGASSGVKWSYSELQTWSSLEKIPSFKWGLLAQPTTEAISREDIAKYFENNVLSCGGEIATIFPMIDGIFIAFKDEAVAEKIWNFRPHRIGGKAVMTYLKVVPTAYQDKLVLKGTQMEPEKLKQILEQSLSKSLPIKKIKPFSSGAFLVLYDSNIGEEDLHRAVEGYKRTIPGMEVSFLVKTDCIHVENVPEDMTECEIKMLFENSERTGGGEVTRIDRLENANFLIYFASYADAESVGERVVSVFGKTLTARRHFHDLQIKRKKLWKPNPLDDILSAWLDKKDDTKTIKSGRKCIVNENIDPDMIKFFCAKPKHVVLLSDQFKDIADVKMTPRGFELSFQSNDAEMEKTAVRVVQEFLGSYTKRNFVVTDNLTKTSIDKEISDAAVRDDVCLRWSRPEKDEVIVTGLKAVVDSFIKSLQHNAQDDGTLRIGEINIRWLVETETMYQLEKDYKAISGHNQKEVFFSGDLSEKIEAKQAIEELMKKLKCTRFQPEKECFNSFLNEANTNKKIFANITEIMKTQKIPVILIINADGICLYGPAACIEKATELLNNALTFAESLEKGTPGMDSTTLAAAWKKILDFQSDGRIKVILQGEMFCLVGFREFVDVAQKELLQCGVTFRRLFEVEQGASRYIYNMDDFSNLCKAVNVSHEATDGGILLRGKKELVETVADALKKWCKDMAKKKVSIVKPGAAEFFESEEGKTLVSTARQEFKCSITVSSKSQVEDRGQKNDFAAAGNLRSSFSLPIEIGPLKVSLRQGDITEETNDAIVNSVGPNFDMTVGALSRAIAEKGGTSIQNELTKFGKNHVFTTTNGKLKCKRIIHVVLPTDLKKMEKSIIDVLKEAEKCGAKSISIPGIGTGIGELHNCKVAKMMLQSFCEFVKKPSQIKHLKVLDVVLFDELQLKDFEKVFLVANEDVDVAKTQQRNPTHPGFAQSRAISEGFGRPYTGNLAVSVRHGDITKETNDAIVNSTNPAFDLSLGMVSKAIVGKGGHQIQSEVYSARGGSVRVTRGGKLKCKKIIHVVASADLTKLGSCITDILDTAEKHHCKSISVPAIGTGNLRLSVAQVAGIMLKAIQDFDLYNSNLKFLSKVDFVIYDKEQVKEFRDAFFGSSPLQAKLSTDSRSKTDCIEVEVFSMERDKTEEAVKYIQQQIDEALGCVIYDDAINKLTDIEERYLRDCEEKNHVQVTRSNGRIVIKGQREDASRAKETVKNILKEFVMNNGNFIWEYHDILDRWQKFDTAQCYELEKLFQESQKTPPPQIVFKGKCESVDFSRMLIGGYIKIRRTPTHGSDNREKSLSPSGNRSYDKSTTNKPQDSGGSFWDFNWLRFR